MKTITPYVLMAIVCLLGCRQSQPIYNVLALRDDANTLTLRCTGYGNTESDALADAGRYAIEQLLFRGIPGTNQRHPLIGTDEQTARTEHATYLQSLLEGKRYLSFLTQSLPVESLQQYHQSQVEAEITINLRALRTDLEQSGVIRKFGL